MKPAVYITAACVVSYGSVAMLFAPDAALELLLGMAMPLVLTLGTMALVDRTIARDPGGLTAFMVRAFGTKLALVGGYVAVVLGLTTLDPVPFVASFVVYFIGLHLTEAIRLKSQLANSPS